MVASRSVRVVLCVVVFYFCRVRIAPVSDQSFAVNVHSQRIKHKREITFRVEENSPPNRPTSTIRSKTNPTAAPPPKTSLLRPTRSIVQRANARETDIERVKENQRKNATTRNVETHPEIYIYIFVLSLPPQLTTDGITSTLNSPNCRYRVNAKCNPKVQEVYITNSGGVIELFT